MDRRTWWTWAAIGLALASGAVIAEAEEQPTPGTATPMPGLAIADLEQQLKSGLKARRPVEFEFIKTVVQKVKDDELPIDLVQSTFFWARRRQPYPYPYFERGLKERAIRAGYEFE
ncbi:MAG: hypothetical protein RLY70_1468 [Planctomycetota bacterium]|jgi:hypothetical protein